MKNKYFLTLTSVLMILLSFQAIRAQSEYGLVDNYIKQNSSNLGLKGVIDFTISSKGTLSQKEYKVLYLQQTFGTVKIANATATVLLKNDEILSFNHTFINDMASKVDNASIIPGIPVNVAATNALAALGLSNTPNVLFLDFATKEDVASRALTTSALTAPKYFQKSSDGKYKLTYEIIVKDPAPHWWVCKINAFTGIIESKFDMNISCNFDAPRETDADPQAHSSHPHTLAKNGTSVLLDKTNKTLTERAKATSNLLADGAVYNAFPLRVETPIHGSRELLIEPSVIPSQPSNRPAPSPNGWHDLGNTKQTNTNGNNVMAYEDGDNTNGPTAASSFVEGGENLVFDFPLDLSQEPDAYRDATIVNLFVWNNYMHDVFYAYGFDEDNGNFQEEDYGRFTGVDLPLVTSHNGDGVAAEAQDGSGLNNANFATPADGANPRMQMFLWGSSPFGEFLDISAPAEFQGVYQSTRFPFVPIPRAEDPVVSAQLVVMQDDGAAYDGANGGTAGPSPETDDGCTAVQNAAALNGNIAIIRRGVCTFTTKIYNAQDAGAIAAIIVNNVEGGGPANGGGEPTDPVLIPTISISLADGDPIITALNNGETITARIIDNGPLSDLVMKDGDLDQGIIAHEYGHGISTRLVGGKDNSNCLSSLLFQEQMGEGWSDFFALVTTQKISDTAEQPRGIGTYVLGQDVLGSGIRPARYSTDFAVNDYTYEDMQNPEVTVPHGVGFIWSTILWDMYWAFIEEYGFDPDMYYGTGGNNMALQLVMDGLKLQTCGNVGFVDGRNAILQADDMVNNGANECLIRGVFARRGVGALAFQGTSASVGDQTPDFTVSAPLGTDCDAVLGVNDFDKTIFTVYPNPASATININSNANSGLGVIAIYDINGRQVMREQLDLTNTATINTASLATGVYVLKITSENAAHTQKLIIK